MIDIRENEFLDYNTDGTYIMYRSRMTERQKFVVCILTAGEAYVQYDVEEVDFPSIWTGRAGYPYGIINIPYSLPPSSASFVATVTAVSEVSLKYDPIRVQADGIYELFQDQTDPTRHRIKRTQISGTALTVDFYDGTCANTGAVATFWAGRTGYTYTNLLNL